MGLKVYVRPFKFEDVTRLISSGMLVSVVEGKNKYSILFYSILINWRPGKFFIFYFNDTILREEHKTIYNGLRITGIIRSCPPPCLPEHLHLFLSCFSLFVKHTFLLHGGRAWSSISQQQKSVGLFQYIPLRCPDVPTGVRLYFNCLDC